MSRGGHGFGSSKKVNGTLVTHSIRPAAAVGKWAKAGKKPRHAPHHQAAVAKRLCGRGVPAVLSLDHHVT
jgi:hypothetical protein